LPQSVVIFLSNDDLQEKSNWIEQANSRNFNKALHKQAKRQLKF